LDDTNSLVTKTGQLDLGAAAPPDLLLAMNAHAIISRCAKPLQNRRIQVLDEKTSSTLMA
jgi:hypothetical protein